MASRHEFMAHSWLIHGVMADPEGRVAARQEIYRNILIRGRGSRWRGRRTAQTHGLGDMD